MNYFKNNKTISLQNLKKLQNYLETGVRNGHIIPILEPLSTCFVLSNQNLPITNYLIRSPEKKDKLKKIL